MDLRINRMRVEWKFVMEGDGKALHDGQGKNEFWSGKIKVIESQGISFQNKSGHPDMMICS